MDPVAELLHDHNMLRGSMALLEGSLNTSRVVPLAASQCIETLGALLRSHVEREERQLTFLNGQLGPAMRLQLQRIRTMHATCCTELITLRELLADGTETKYAVRMQARHLAHELWSHMNEEEAIWFPQIRRITQRAQRGFKRSTSQRPLQRGSEAAMVVARGPGRMACKSMS